MIAHSVRTGVSAVILPVRHCQVCDGSWPAAGCFDTGWRCVHCGSLELPSDAAVVRFRRLLHQAVAPVQPSPDALDLIRDRTGAAPRDEARSR